jgi:hypothetical protein
MRSIDLALLTVGLDPMAMQHDQKQVLIRNNTEDECIVLDIHQRLIED